MKKIFLFILLFTVSCSQQSKLSKLTNDITVEKNLKTNNKNKENAPYVLLISLDGYRHDYTRMYNPKVISNFLKQGSSTRSLMPSYPTKTFPNHYSIVTGLYPDNHGIVSNYFHAPDLKKDYSLKNRSAVTNKDFYKGSPIWNTASKNGLLSATLFWPGSEADINGKFPDYYRVYDHSLSMKKRVDTIINWMKLPKENRPHFMTMYYHHIDSAGHMYGPNSVEVKDAITSVDESLGSLFQQIRQTGLPVNIILVSDHGMTEISSKKTIYLSEILKSKHEKDLLNRFMVVGGGPIMHFYYKDEYKNKTTDSRTLSGLLNKRPLNHRAFIRGSLPKKLNFNKNIRMGEVVIKVNMGWSIKENTPLIPEHDSTGGNHGYSQFEGQDMHGILYAKGPNIIAKKRLKTVRNIHIYPFLTKLLGISFNHRIDGDLMYLAPLYKSN